MLDSETIKKIEDYVASQPRSILEIAQMLHKNWRTADRYVEEIRKNYGTLEIKTFRGGTRGALKVVYWASVEKISHSVFQEKLEKEILAARRKEDFSAFDLFQHVSDKNKKAYLEKGGKIASKELEELFSLIGSAKKQLLIFSGNLSFLDLSFGSKSFYALLEELVKKKISIKILCRVDIESKEQIEKVLSLNFKSGLELIEIHHREHPLRAFVIDNLAFRIKEVKDKSKNLILYYTIKDKEWTEWLSKIFWKMFSESIGSMKRMEELRKIF